MSSLLNQLNTLSDLARLRVLRLLDREELSVGELARALQLPQSTVSRHLKLLLEGAWVARRSEGTASLYRMVPDLLDADARALWDVVRQRLATGPTVEEDDRRLVEVLAERRTDTSEFFGRIGGEWDRLRHDLFGEQFTSDALLDLIEDDIVIADIGCGTADAAQQLAPRVRTVIAIDREAAMLDAARKRLSDHPNVEFRADAIEDLPLEDAEVDVIIVMLVMHHVAEPETAVREIARALRPGGRVLIVDMVAHDRAEYRHSMGHKHLGFGESDVHGWASASGLDDVRYRHLRPDTEGKGPGLFAATMRKPS